MKRILEQTSDRRVSARTEQTESNGHAILAASEQPKLSEKDRAKGAALQILKANFLALDTWVATQPQIAERAGDYNQLRLPVEVWKLILVQMADISVGRTIQTCRGLYHLGRDLVWSTVHPLSNTGRQQRAQCDANLDPILTECGSYLSTVRQDTASGHAVRSEQFSISRFTARFETELKKLAMHNRNLQVVVYPGFEQATLRALSTASRWQTVHLKFPLNSSQKGADTKLVARLEQSLHAQGRKAAIDLTIEEPKPGNWPGTLPRNAALMLTGLNVTEVDYEDLDGLRSLLEGPNALERLKLSGEDTPDSLLPWLKAGSHGLTKLHLNDCPWDDKLMLDVLRTLNGVTSFALHNGAFQPNKLTFAQLLQAAPQLEELSLDDMEFEPGADAGTLEALKNSSVRQISFLGCLLSVSADVQPQDRVAKKRETHKELLSGLSAAPNLAVLGVSNKRETYDAIGDELLLQAFALNPKASMVLIKRGEVKELDEYLCKENAIREQKGWGPIALHLNYSPD
jgi:hypothetical protein